MFTFQSHCGFFIFLKGKTENKICVPQMGRTVRRENVHKQKKKESYSGLNKGARRESE